MKNLDNHHFIPVSSRKHRIFYEQFLKRSTLEKRLIILLIIAVGLLIISLGVIFVGDKTHEVCITRKCVQSASRLLEGLNTSANPCDDFYEYACGKWKDVHFNPLDEENSWIIDRTEFIHYKIKKFLEDTDNSSDIKPIQQIKLMYKMCMDTEQLNEQGLDPLYRILDALELPRGLPDDLSAENFNLARTLSLAQRLFSFDMLINLSIQRDNVLNSTLLVLSPSINEFPLFDRQEEIKDKTMEQLLVCQLNYMAGVMFEFNTNNSFSMNELFAEASKIILLESQLRKDMNQIKYQTDEGFFMTLAQLQEYMFSNVTNETNIGEALFSWQDYISVLTEKLNINLTMNYVVCVEDPLYFQTLGRRLGTLKKVVFQRLVWWKVVDLFAIHTTNIMRTHKHILEQRTYKGVSKPTRSSECINLLKTFSMDLLIHKMITLHNVSDVIDEVYSMLLDLQNIFKQSILDSTWLDDGAKYFRIEKIDNLIPIIGYPKMWSNSSWIIHRYRNMEVLPNEFLKSLSIIRAWRIDELLSSLNSTYSPQLDDYEASLFIDPLEINAYYSENFNLIVIPFSFLQFPFYMPNFPSLNYGAIGSVIGHELSHMFDDENFLHLEQQLTQQNKTKVEYEKRSQCFVKQYNNFSNGDNTTVNGVETLSENIADNEGIRKAFLAYAKYSKKYGSGPILPSFEKFTDLQLFFLSYANLMCKRENRFKLNDMLVDDHSPNRFRVIGPLANLAEFSETWNCPSNSPMNPKTKCTIL